ncbi:hypothetical protein BC831DRAFT_485426, partial [Entophlyctis helioformis]
LLLMLLLLLLLLTAPGCASVLAMNGTHCTLRRSTSLRSLVSCRSSSAWPHAMAYATSAGAVRRSSRSIQQWRIAMLSSRRRMSGSGGVWWCTARWATAAVLPATHCEAIQSVSANSCAG